MTATSSPSSPSAILSDAAESDSSRRGSLRAAGIAAIVAVVATLITPLTVFGISPFVPEWADPDFFRDPVNTGALPWLGAVYGVQGIVIGGALALLVVNVRRVLPSSVIRDVGAAGGLAGALGWLISGGSSAALYSRTWSSSVDFTTLVPDAGTRSLMSWTELLDTQGIVGAAGVGLGVWGLGLAVAGRRAGIVGRFYPVVAGIVAALVAVVYIVGAGAAGTLIALVVLAAAAVWALRASRR